MRIIHTSDLHIGAPFGARLSSDKIRQRKAEITENFARLCEEAKRVGADAVIIAGDLLDSDKVHLRVCQRIISAIESAPGVDFIYLPGNHEKSAFVECGLPMPKNLKIFTRERTSFDYGEVTVYGISDVSRNMLDTLSPNGDSRNILVLHGALGDGKSSDNEIGIQDLSGKGLDYVALGHYHSYAVKDVDKRCKAVYSGTLEGRGYDEVGEKGYVLVDIDKSGAHHTFVRFAKRTVRRVEMDAEGIYRKSELLERASLALSAIPKSDMVRLAFVGKKSPELVIDTAALLARWGESFFHFDAVDETKIKLNPAEYAADKSLKGEFIRLVSAKEDLSEEEKGQIISCGINALMGEFYEV